MEVLFRRYFWIFHVVFLAMSAYLLAGVSMHFLEHVLSSKFAESAAEQKGPARAPAKRGGLRDFKKASEQNIFNGKREDVSVNLAAKADVGCQKDDECSAGEKCLPVEGALPGSPQKKCQQPGPLGELSNAVLSELGLTLVGTSVFSEPEYSLASVIDENDGRKAEAGLYSINPCEAQLEAPPDAGPAHEAFLQPEPAPCNLLQDAHKLVLVHPDRIYILNTEENRYEFIPLEEPEGKKKSKRKKPKKKKKKKGKKDKDDDLGKGITKTGPNSYEVTRDEVDNALGNLSKLATQARIVPAFEGGEPIGFKLFSIRPGSLYSKIGVQNGDVIQKVNGYEITSPDKALELYQKLKDGAQFTVDIKRRGKPVTLEYGITQ